MKIISLIAAFLISLSSFAQRDELKVGEIWMYSHPYIRTTPDSVQLHEFDYNDGLAKVTYNKKIGFIDSSKVIVIPLIYEYGLGANRFSNSQSIAVKDGYWGVIDQAGKEVIPCKYGKIRERDSLYCVYEYEGYGWGFLDRTGNTILPLDEHGRSSVMTKEEVHKLTIEYFKKDSLEKSTSISKKKAISIAKRKGYYWENEFPFGPRVELDTSLSRWIIISSRNEGVSYEGHCAHTNGCTIIHQARIEIDANNGKVLEKTKHRSKMANYE